MNVSSLENDTEASYTWDYVSVLQGGVLAEKVREAFANLSFREQTLLEKRCAICMTCGRVAPLSERASFEDLAIEFESSSPRTAERAYRRAVEKLTLNLVELCELHVVRIEWMQYKTLSQSTAAPLIHDCVRLVRVTQQILSYF